MHKHKLADINEIENVTDVTIRVVATLSWDHSKKVAMKAGRIILSQLPQDESRERRGIEVHYRRGHETRSVMVKHRND